MKKIITASLLAIAVIIGGVLAARTVNAQTSDQATRCNVTQNRLNTRITQVNAVKESHTTAYNDLNAKVEVIVTSAEASGFDTTELTTAYNSVEEKISAYQSAATAYADALMATKNLSCGTSDTEFTTSLTTARAALATVRTASADVRAAFTSETVPALQDYAVWLTEQLAEEEAN